jgi:hypothetical protein
MEIVTVGAPRHRWIDNTGTDPRELDLSDSSRDHGGLL